MDCDPINAKESENVPAPGEFDANNPLTKNHPLADLLGMALESRIALNSLKESILTILPKEKSNHHATPGIRWLTSAQAMKMLNISRTTIKRYRKNNMIRFIVFHGQYRYRLTDLQELSTHVNSDNSDINNAHAHNLNH